MDWYLKVLKEYAKFTGRARRKEFWMFTLFHSIFIILLAILLSFTSANTNSYDYETDSYSTGDNTSFYITAGLLVVYILATFLPTVALTVRRLHDTGKSGWWYFISFIPYIGSFILLIMVCMEGEAKTNNWGHNPKGINNDSSIDQIGVE